MNNVSGYGTDKPKTEEQIAYYSTFKEIFKIYGLLSGDCRRQYELSKNLLDSQYKTLEHSFDSLDDSSDTYSRRSEILSQMNTVNLARIHLLGQFNEQIARLDREKQMSEDLSNSRREKANLAIEKRFSFQKEEPNKDTTSRKRNFNNSFGNTPKRNSTVKKLRIVDQYSEEENE